MQQLTLAASMAVALLSLSTCNKGPIETVSSVPTPQPGISVIARQAKPGADIRFDHDFDGQIIPQQLESVELSFLAKYPNGRLSIRLQADSGLVVSPAIDEYSLTLDTNDPLMFNLGLTAEEPGKYYLTLFATITSATGMPVHRVFALAVNAGESAPHAETTVAVKTNGSQIERLIFLPVTEVIHPGTDALL